MQLRCFIAFGIAFWSSISIQAPFDVPLTLDEADIQNLTSININRMPLAGFNGSVAQLSNPIGASLVHQQFVHRFKDAITKIEKAPIPDCWRCHFGYGDIQRVDIRLKMNKPPTRVIAPPMILDGMDIKASRNFGTDRRIDGELRYRHSNWPIWEGMSTTSLPDHPSKVTHWLTLLNNENMTQIDDAVGAAEHLASEHRTMLSLDMALCLYEKEDERGWGRPVYSFETIGKEPKLNILVGAEDRKIDWWYAKKDKISTRETEARLMH